MRFTTSLVLLVFCSMALLGCKRSNDTSKEQKHSDSKQGSDDGQVLEPPFDVKGEAEGLLMVWFDHEGPHVAEKRSQIPQTARARVRVDSDALSPKERLDPEWVYVADMRKAKKGGSYPSGKSRVRILKNGLI
ncbi:MAG: hypothetical protein IPJ88_07340 [Myxococcales bacterium]|nr:MAG: hypothetical protein IPJ88_07340 [Myxococcales bacterium]